MTYAGAYGRDEVGPVGWDPHREWALAREAHLLGLRRAEITKIAVEDIPASHLRWALGVAAGAVLVAGTFVAASLSGTSEVANSAGSVPEHVLAPLEQGVAVTEPQAEAPAPEPAPAPAPVNVQPQQETTPASTEQQQADTATQDPARGNGENQRTTPSANTPAPTPPPAPAPAPPQNEHGGSGGQWGQGSHSGGYGGQWGSGGQWGHGGQWGSGAQWGQGSHSGGQWGGHGGQWGSGSQWGHGNQHRSPGSGFGAPTMSSYSAAKATPNGPAMSMLNPACDSTGR